MSDIIDALKDFALPARRLFPCDTPSLVRASAVAFEAESHKLPAQEKIAAARHIARRAKETGLEDRHRLKFARIAGDDVSPMFKVALKTREGATAWHPEAVKELRFIAKLAARIAEHKEHGPETRMALLDKLAAEIEAFDERWDKDKCWRDNGVPDAVDTVFARVVEDTDVVRFGDGREVRAADLNRLDKNAGKYLTPYAIKTAASWDDYVAADDVTQAAIASFIPRS